MLSFDTSLSGLIVLALSFVFLYHIVLVLYRLYCSPLAAFPGPKLAAASFWYEFYYDVVLRGQYIFHVQKLHDRYGPIIRINPCELHVSDPEFYDILYASSASKAKRDKWGWYTKQFGTPGATFSTISHDQHKTRRTALARYFSTASVHKLQAVIQERVNRLVQRFEEAKDLNTPIPLEYAFSALTNDVVVQYCYGESDHRVECPTWAPDYHLASAEAGKLGSLMKQMFWIFNLISTLPPFAQRKLSPSLALVLALRARVMAIIERVKSEPKPAMGDTTHSSIFHEMLQNPALPEPDKDTKRLTDEALIVVGAGTLTTSWALCVATFHLLSSPRILARLKNELYAAFPDTNSQPSLSQVEQLPYLNAIIQETLRLSYGVSTRLQRIPHEPLRFEVPEGSSWIIPAGTPVSMTSVLLHHNESNFPDSKAFLPERWLGNPQLDKYLVAFSKGSRNCLGMNLAYAEMRLCLSSIFRRFGSAEPRASGLDGSRTDNGSGVLRLFETTIKDVEIVADGFVPLHDESAKGIHILVES